MIPELMAPEKLLNTGFIPRFKVEDAIKEIKEKFLTGDLNESDNCYTVKWMKKLKLNNFMEIDFITNHHKKQKEIILKELIK